MTSNVQQENTAPIDTLGFLSMGNTQSLDAQIAFQSTEGLVICPHCGGCKMYFTWAKNMKLGVV